MLVFDYPLASIFYLDFLRIGALFVSFVLQFNVMFDYLMVAMSWFHYFSTVII